MNLAQLDDDFFFHLNRLRPFGPGNPPPVLACLAAQLVDSRIVGKKHLKLKLAQDGRVHTAIAFDQAGLHPLRGNYDIAFTPQLNFYQGRRNLNSWSWTWAGLPGENPLLLTLTLSPGEEGIVQAKFLPPQVLTGL